MNHESNELLLHEEVGEINDGLGTNLITVQTFSNFVDKTGKLTIVLNKIISGELFNQSIEAAWGILFESSEDFWKQFGIYKPGQKIDRDVTD